MIECPSCRVSAHPGIWENWVIGGGTVPIDPHSPPPPSSSRLTEGTE